MDVAYINPFLIASQEVFQKMVKVGLSLEKPYLRRGSETSAAVNAVVKLEGAVTGSVFLRFSQPMALAAADGLSGQAQAGLTDDCLDALGEIANMIVGNAKKLLPSETPVNMSTPKVLLGSGGLEYPENQPFIVIPCATRKGRFVIEVGLRKPGKNEPALKVAPAPQNAPAPAGDAPTAAPAPAATAAPTAPPAATATTPKAEPTKPAPVV
ncbi:MAG: chemotaxis protein CheX [Tepidisphaerales bacterium]